jgi:hypothetical protein
VRDNCERRRQIDESGQQILNQLRFARLMAPHDERAQKSDREPRRSQPPNYLERAREETLKPAPNHHTRVIRHNATDQHQAGKKDKQQQSNHKVRQGTASPPVTVADEPGDAHDARQKERIGHYLR